jgi:hypothetical protein
MARRLPFPANEPPSRQQCGETGSNVRDKKQHALTSKRLTVMERTQQAMVGYWWYRRVSTDLKRAGMLAEVTSFQGPQALGRSIASFLILPQDIEVMADTAECHAHD